MATAPGDLLVAGSACDMPEAGKNTLLSSISSQLLAPLTGKRIYYVFSLFVYTHFGTLYFASSMVSA